MGHPRADYEEWLLQHDGILNARAGCFRLLAPFEANLDAIEPENLAEAQRIAALPPKKLVVIAQGKNGPAGFISELPKTI